MSTISATLNDITTELFKLLQAHRGTPVMQRINAFMVEKTERNMDCEIDAK